MRVISAITSFSSSRTIPDNSDCRCADDPGRIDRMSGKLTQQSRVDILSHRVLLSCGALSTSQPPRSGGSHLPTPPKPA